uniref:PTP_tm domain-containing protein n=1 Tax=Dracunculus medinensis TaxID=318479 RepID=A0A0N4U6M9_DRAME
LNVDATAKDIQAITVIDRLIGGLSYQFDVNAVTEAGEGGRSASSFVLAKMPILAPPRPTSKIEVLHETITSTNLIIRFSTAMFNTKNGLLTKCALIVCEVNKNIYGKWVVESWSNRTVTWGQASKYDIWPNYIAVEKPIEPVRIFLPNFISETIGIDNTCKNADPEIICNGPLKPATSYRFKLRIYTAPSLWTETELSEVAVTKINK